MQPDSCSNCLNIEGKDPNCTLLMGGWVRYRDGLDIPEKTKYLLITGNRTLPHLFPIL
jgi:hypothetical protein